MFILLITHFVYAKPIRDPMERVVLQMEHRLCSKILILEEQFAEHKMDGALRTRLCSIEDGITDVRRDVKVWVRT